MAEENPQSPQSKSGKARKPRMCSLAGCDNPGILVCPTCQEQRREKVGWWCPTVTLPLDAQKHPNKATSSPWVDQP